MLKILKKMLYIISVLLSLLIVGIVLFLNTPKFGKLPSGERLKRIEASPNYKNGKFVNLEHTPQLTSDKSFIQSLYEYLFKKAKSSNLPRKYLPKRPISAISPIILWSGSGTPPISFG